ICEGIVRSFAALSRRRGEAPLTWRALDRPSPQPEAMRPTLSTAVADNEPYAAACHPRAARRRRGAAAATGPRPGRPGLPRREPAPRAVRGVGPGPVLRDRRRKARRVIGPL